jgi:hypothetical protein
MNNFVYIFFSIIGLAIITFSSLKINNKKNNKLDNTSSYSKQSITPTIDFYYPAYNGTNVSIDTVKIPVSYLSDSANLPKIVNDFSEKFMTIYKKTIENQNFSSPKLSRQIPYSFTLSKIEPVSSIAVEKFPSSIENYLKYFHIPTTNHYYNYLYNICILQLLLEKVMKINYIEMNTSSKLNLDELKFIFQKMNEMIINDSVQFEAEQVNITLSVILVLVLFILFYQRKPHSTLLQKIYLSLNLIVLVVFGIMTYGFGYPTKVKSFKRSKSFIDSKNIYSQFELIPLYDKLRDDLFFTPLVNLFLYICIFLVYFFILKKK